MLVIKLYNIPWIVNGDVDPAAAVQDPLAKAALVAEGREVPVSAAAGDAVVARGALAVRDRSLELSHSFLQQHHLQMSNGREVAWVPAHRAIKRSCALVFAHGGQHVYRDALKVKGGPRLCENEVKMCAILLQRGRE